MYTMYWHDVTAYRSLCNGQDQHPQMKSIIHPPVPATPFAEIHEPQYPKTVPTLPPTEEEPEDDECVFSCYVTLV